MNRSFSLAVVVVAWMFVSFGAGRADFDTSCIGASLGYVRRDLWHGHAFCDWVWLLDFADRALRRENEREDK